METKNNINIAATSKSPGVTLDTELNIFEIQGNSRPENVRDFYYPLIDKLKKYFEDLLAKNKMKATKDLPLEFKFKLTYFNSSSAKFILDILVLIKEYEDLGFNIKIYWHYDEDDEDMHVVGQDFSDMIDFPFIFIMVQF